MEWHRASTHSRTLSPGPTMCQVLLLQEGLLCARRYCSRRGPVSSPGNIAGVKGEEGTGRELDRNQPHRQSMK